MKQVDSAGNRCGDIIRGREENLKRMQGDVGRANEALRNVRVELQQAREDAFREVLGRGMVGSGLGSPPPGDMPPMYAPPSGPPPGYAS
jgi:hypothetical protein